MISVISSVENVILSCHLFLMNNQIWMRGNSWIIGLHPGKTWFSDDPDCLKFYFSSMLCCIDKVRASVFPIAGFCVSSLNGKRLSKHNWETRITVCHCTGLLCPILSIPPLLPVGNTIVLASWISSSCAGLPCARSGSL